MAAGQRSCAAINFDGLCIVDTSENFFDGVEGSGVAALANVCAFNRIISASELAACSRTCL